MIVVPTGPMILPGTVVKIKKEDIETPIKRPTQGMIMVPRPPVVRRQEDIPEQQLHGLRTEQLLCRLPSQLPMFCRQNKLNR